MKKLIMLIVVLISLLSTSCDKDDIVEPEPTRDLRDPKPIRLVIHDRVNI